MKREESEYRATGHYTGSSIAKGETLAYIKANPEAIAKEQAELATWLKGLGK